MPQWVRFKYGSAVANRREDSIRRFAHKRAKRKNGWCCGSMAKKMTSDMESKCEGKGCCCGCGGCKNKLWLKALLGLVLLIGGLNIVTFTGWGNTPMGSWFNIWTVVGAYLVVMAAMKMSG